MPTAATDVSLEEYNETALLMVESVSEFFQKKGFQLDDARAAGIALVGKICNEFGGSYLPRNKTRSVFLRNQEIISDFNGKNYRELAIKYKMTEVAIRGIVKKRASYL